MPTAIPAIAPVLRLGALAVLALPLGSVRPAVFGAGELGLGLEVVLGTWSDMELVPVAVQY
jgi:hypothetical protein